MIKLSKPSKMPCLSWSLVARDTCPGSIHNGELVDACKGCYAAQGNYRFPNVKAPRVHNKDDWKRDSWVSGGSRRECLQQPGAGSRVRLGMVA